MISKEEERESFGPADAMMFSLYHFRCRRTYWKHDIMIKVKSYYYFCSMTLNKIDLLPFYSRLMFQETQINHKGWREERPVPHNN